MRSLINNSFENTQKLRIALIADTHMPGTIESLWPQVHEAFQGVDCILHAGDLHVADVIDELESIAPTFVCCGNGDLDVEHPRLQDTWVGTFGGVEIGLVHKFPTPRRADETRLNKKSSHYFAPAEPQIIIYGHTHLAEVHTVAGKTYINPGSPTLPNNQSTRFGTVGFLSIDDGHVSVDLYQIEENGLTLIEPASC